MTFRTSREIAASPAEVFAAFADTARLAKWWGPAGFTNTFSICEFRTGGEWAYVMHGPDGMDYKNQSVFYEVESLKRVIIHHISKPKYVLTIDLEEMSDGGTRVRWEQEFEKPQVAEGIAHIVVPANEQNLDRLSAEVLRAVQLG